MACGLLDKLPTVGEDKRLCRIFGRSFYSLYELSEDDLTETSAVNSREHISLRTDSLATAGSKRHPKSLVSLFEVRKHSLDTFFLILSQFDLYRVA